MDVQKLIDICNDVENKSNNDLTTASNYLFDEYNNTKDLIIDLTRHLEILETNYKILQKELKKRYNI